MILPFSHWFQGVRRMTVTFRKRMRLLMRRILWNSNWRNSNQPRLRSSQAQSKLIVKSLHAMPLYQSWQGTTEIAIKISKQVSKRKESSAAGTGVQYAQKHLTMPYVSIISGIGPEPVTCWKGTWAPSLNDGLRSLKFLVGKKWRGSGPFSDLSPSRR